MDSDDDILCGKCFKRYNFHFQRSYNKKLCKENPYQCLLCDMNFTRESHLYRHRHLHANCRICFFNPRELDDHATEPYKSKECKNNFCTLKDIEKGSWENFSKKVKALDPLYIKCFAYGINLRKNCSSALGTFKKCLVCGKRFASQDINRKHHVEKIISKRRIRKKILSKL